MWEIRITDVSDLNVRVFIKDVGGSVIAVREGEPFDKGISPHVHIFIDNKTNKVKSESFIRKRIQELDPNRKGNELYSMKKSHENTPNYVLKRIFEETQEYEEVEASERLLYHSPDFLRLNFGQWLRQHVDYIASIKQEKKIKKKIKKSTTLEMVLEIAEKYEGVDSLSPNSFIDDVVEWHASRDLLLPSRSNMERYLVTIYQRYKNNTLCLRTYYSLNFF